MRRRMKRKDENRIRMIKGYEDKKRGED